MNNANFTHIPAFTQASVVVFDRNVIELDAKSSDI